MSNKMISLVMALAFVASSATVSFAGDCKGWVKAVNGTTVTVVCADGTETKAEGAVKVGFGYSVVVKDGKVLTVRHRAMEDC